MLIQEFEKKYCQDILEIAEFKKVVVEDIDFTYDAIIELGDGSMVKVVYDDAGNEILVEDILTLQDTDFMKAYPALESLEMYKRYLDAFIILEGEEVLEALRNRVKEARTRIEKYASLPSEAFE